MLEAMLPIPHDETGLSKDTTPSMGISTAVLESFFLISLYWSLGATLVEESRVRFDEMVKKLSQLPVNTAEGVHVDAGEIPISLEMLYEYHFNPDTHKWVPWKDKVPEYLHDPDRKFNEILVPTVDTFRTTWLLELMVKVKRPCLLVGESGTSKTATVSNYLRTVDKEANVSVVQCNTKRISYDTIISMCVAVYGMEQHIH